MVEKNALVGLNSEKSFSGWSVLLCFLFIVLKKKIKEKIDGGKERQREKGEI